MPNCVSFDSTTFTCNTCAAGSTLDDSKTLCTPVSCGGLWWPAGGDSCGACGCCCFMASVCSGLVLVGGAAASAPMVPLWMPQCDPNCATFGTDGTCCTACQPGFVLSAGTCTPVSEGGWPQTVLCTAKLGTLPRVAALRAAVFGCWTHSGQPQTALAKLSCLPQCEGAQRVLAFSATGSACDASSCRAGYTLSGTSCLAVRCCYTTALPR